MNKDKAHGMMKTTDRLKKKKKSVVLLKLGDRMHPVCTLVETLGSGTSAAPQNSFSSRPSLNNILLHFVAFVLPGKHSREMNISNCH